MTIPKPGQTDYFDELQTQKKRMLRSRPRAGMLGLVLGAGIALSFGYVSQTVNAWSLPGIWLASDPFGYLGNLLAYGILGALTGWLCTAAVDEVEGVGISTGLWAAFFYTILVLTPYVRLDERLKLAFFSFVPVVGFACFALLFLILVRWSVELQLDWTGGALGRLPRLLPALVALAAAALLARFALLPGEQRQALRATDTLVQEGLAAARDVLPTRLQNVTGGRAGSQPFPAIASRDYSLEVVHAAAVRDVLAQRLGLPVDSDYGVVVLVRFANGWPLVCLYDTSAREVFICQSVSPGELPSPPLRWGDVLQPAEDQRALPLTLG